jgi:hypothetical protein
MTKKLLGASAGQYLSLAVAAHLAHTQLAASPPRKARDARPPSGMLDTVANALARTATLYATDVQTGAPRPLTHGQIARAKAKRGATVLVLQDGATLTDVSLRRDELRQAIAILKAVGLPGMTPPPRPAENRAPVEDIEPALRSRYVELAEMLEPPLLPAQMERARAAAIWIARSAPQGPIAKLAMELMSALHLCSAADDGCGVRVPLMRLRNAIEETATTRSGKELSHGWSIDQE